MAVAQNPPVPVIANAEIGTGLVDRAPANTERVRSARMTASNGGSAR